MRARRALSIEITAEDIAVLAEVAKTYASHRSIPIDPLAVTALINRATAAESRERALLTALARIDDLACRLCAETMDGDVEQWALEIAAVAQEAQHGAYMADAALDGSEGAG